MAKEIDPRLLDRIKTAGEKGEVEAVIIFAKNSKVITRKGQEPMALSLDNAIKDINENPSHVRSLPKLGVMILKGSSRLINRILEEPDVISATVPDNEFTKETKT